jgi:glyoxylate/hydroxypyruvate reductase A
MDIALVGSKTNPETWLPRLREALPQDRFFVHPEAPDPASVSVALVAAPKPGEVAQLPNLKLAQCLWMGVDALLLDKTLPKGVPVARMVDPSMVAAMSETVLHCVIDFHRHFHAYRRQQAERVWKHQPQRMASDRTVGFLGLGELGADAAAKLVALGFRVCGWSRSRKSLPGVECFAGDEGLAAMLPKCDMLVCLLPLTPQTKGMLSRKLFDRMKDGSALISVARGTQMVTADVVAALASGKLAHAYLDVFETEPLPADDPLWSNPKVSITPHIAALTEPRTALAVITDNVERVRRGEKPLYLVDFGAGY